MQPEIRRSSDSSAFGSRPRPAEESSFGARLRRERERRNVSIASIAESTKILGALLEGLERDDVSRWPTGFYRRAFIRAYATAIGVDPEPVVREFLERFPDPEDVPARPPVVTPPAPPATHAPRAPATMLRLTFAEHNPSFTSGPVIRELLRRGSAVAFDAFVLSGVGLGCYVWLGVLWAPLAIAAASYYGLGILVLGNTPGVCLFASDPTERLRRQLGRPEPRSVGRNGGAGS